MQLSGEGAEEGQAWETVKIVKKGHEKVKVYLSTVGVREALIWGKS